MKDLTQLKRVVTQACADLGVAESAVFNTPQIPVILPPLETDKELAGQSFWLHVTTPLSGLNVAVFARVYDHVLTQGSNPDNLLAAHLGQRFGDSFRFFYSRSRNLNLTALEMAYFLATHVPGSWVVEDQTRMFVPSGSARGFGLQNGAWTNGYRRESVDDLVFEQRGPVRSLHTPWHGLRYALSQVTDPEPGLCWALGLLALSSARYEGLPAPAPTRATSPIVVRQRARAEATALAVKAAESALLDEEKVYQVFSALVPLVMSEQRFIKEVFPIGRRLAVFSPKQEAAFIKKLKAINATYELKLRT